MVSAGVERERLQRRTRLLGVTIPNGNKVCAAHFSMADATVERPTSAIEIENRLGWTITRVFPT